MSYEQGFQSPPANGLRVSLRPSGVKSLQQITQIPRFQQNKITPGQLNINNNNNGSLPHPTFEPYKANPPPESAFKSFNNPIVSPRMNHASNSFSQPIKQFEARLEGVQKKMSAHLDPSQILPPGAYSASHLRKTSFEQQNFQGSNFSGPGSTLNKQDLRTSYTTSNMAPKFVDKDFLRKTTFAPIKGMFSSESSLRNDHNNDHTNIHASSNAGIGIQASKMFAKKHFEVASEPVIAQHMNVDPHLRFQRGQSVKHSPVVCGFELGKTLGSGKFGQVFVARHVLTGFVVALKKIVKAKVKEFNMMNQLSQEIRIHAFLNHPNIVQYYGFVSDEQNVYIILQYMEGGTLFDYMNDKERLPESESVVFLREVTHAVKYLHDINIAHRDIKPENIVLSYGVAKLCDFGWSARVNGVRKTYCGTFDYAPPEILERKEYDETVDLWCLGVLAYEMMTGKVPFEHEERKVVMQKIVNVDKDKFVYPKDLTAEARDFIECLVRKNPNQRTKSYKLINHPFLLRNDNKAD